MPFEKPDIYGRVWKRIQPFVVDHFEDDRYVGPARWECSLCHELWTNDMGKMCIHFNSNHKDAIAFGALAE